MAREPKSGKKPIEQYDHKDKKRVNNLPVRLVSPELDRDRGVKAYTYDPHLDPQFQWSGKTETDEELIGAYRGAISLPFEPGDNKRIAVK